jgi:hypothetical protein
MNRLTGAALVFGFTGMNVLGACGSSEPLSENERSSNVDREVRIRVAADLVGKTAAEEFRLYFLDSESYKVSDGQYDVRAKMGDDCLKNTPYDDLSELLITREDDQLVVDPVAADLETLIFKELDDASLLPINDAAFNIFYDYECIMRPHTVR